MNDQTHAWGGTITLDQVDKLQFGSHYTHVKGSLQPWNLLVKQSELSSVGAFLALEEGFHSNHVPFLLLERGATKETKGKRNKAEKPN